MFNIFISHISALKFYWNARINNIVEIVNNKGINILGANIYTPEINKWTLMLSNVFPNAKQKTKSCEAIKHTIPFVDTDNKLDVLISRKTNQNKTTKLNYHLWTKRLPPYSFIKVANGIYVSCPELLFFQLADIFSIEELLILGMEFCGTYATNKINENSLITNIPPLTTPTRIRKYLSSLNALNHNTRGINKAIRAAKYLESNSASPKETNLYIMLCAPRYLGGFGITDFKLNKTIKLSKESRDILGYPTIKPDLCSPKNKIALEYDSSAFHDNEGQNTKDKLRLDALHNDGWTVLSYVPAIMNNINAFDALAKRILYLNKQDTRIKTKNFEEKKINLINTIKHMDKIQAIA